MELAAIKASFASGASKAAEAIKNAAVWAGRMIKTGFDKLVDVVKLCWDKAVPFVKDLFSRLGQFLRTAPGIALVGGVAGTVLGVAAESIENNRWTAIALRVGAAACFVGTGVAIGVGLSTGFNVPVI